MMWKISLAFLFAFVLCSCEQSTIHPKKQTNDINIVLVIADDMSAYMLDNYSLRGATPAKTPTLDSIKSIGLTFTNCWSNPVCSPTRASIMTGRYGVHTKTTGTWHPNIELRIEQANATLFNEIKRNSDSIDLALIGKWHLAPSIKVYNHPNDMGVPYFEGFLGGQQNYNDWEIIKNGAVSRSQKYMTSHIVDLSLDWIKARTKRNFLLWQAQLAPHSPFHLPPIHLHTRGIMPNTPADVNQNAHLYYIAMLEALDKELGRFLMSIPDKQNTLFIFTADNGCPPEIAGGLYPKEKGKGTLYQGGINVPLIVFGSGVSRLGQIDASLINTSDIFATIMDVLNIKPRESHPHSISFKPLLSYPFNHSRTFQYSDVSYDPVHKTEGWAVSDGRYKLIVANGKKELYDLQNDPLENSDLLKNPVQFSIDKMDSLYLLGLDIRRPI